MTNFEIITQNPYNLEKFIEMLVEDALEAKGCSRDLTMPNLTILKDGEYFIGWEDWLNKETEDNYVETTRGSIDGNG